MSKVSGKKYTCVKSGKKLVWDKGVVVKTPTPTPTPNLENVLLVWELTPEQIGDPGVLNDPQPQILQDGGINSSFVVKATLQGKPTSNIVIVWKSSDPSSRIEAYADSTDANGLARIWFINGSMGDATVTAKVEGGLATLSKDLSRDSTITKTLGRPVIVGFIPEPNRDYNKVSVTATMNTDPVGTYYAFANFSNFYTGLQSVVCNGWDMYEKVCLDSRGKFKGREGHFSVWDGKSPAGVILTPKFVEASTQTKCSPFDHEGSGQMCIVAFDWLPNDKVTINIEKISGAPVDYVRLKVSAFNISSNLLVNFATIDVPGGVNLATEFAAFNENYLVGSADNCLAVEERSFTINRVDFVIGDTIYKPVRAYAYGNVVAQGSTLCQNYGFDTRSDGIELHSGGKGRWIDFSPGLDNSAGFRFFRDDLQSKIMIRDIQLGAIGK